MLVSIYSSLPDCFPPDAKVLPCNLIFVHGSCDLFDLDIFGTSVRPLGHSGKTEFGSSLLIQWEGEVSMLGCYWAEWDSMAARLEISASGCCVCQRPVSCSLAL